MDANQQRGLSGPEDYVFMPEFGAKQRDRALKLLQHQFDALLDLLGIKMSPQGDPRTIRGAADLRSTRSPTAATRQPVELALQGGDAGGVFGAGFGAVVEWGGEAGGVARVDGLVA